MAKFYKTPADEMTVHALYQILNQVRLDQYTAYDRKDWAERDRIADNASALQVAIDYIRNNQK